MDREKGGGVLSVNCKNEAAAAALIDFRVGLSLGPAAEKINAWNRQLAKLQTQETNLKNLKTSLMPWAPLDLPLELQETAASVFQLGTCPLAVNLSELTA